MNTVMLFEKLGDCYAYLLNNPNESFGFYKKAIDAYEKEETDFHFAELHIKAGNSLIKSSTVSKTEHKALDYFSKAIFDICENSRSKYMIAECYESIANYYKHKRNNHKEIEFLEEALAIHADDAGEHAARIRNRIFCAYSNLGEKRHLALNFLLKSNEFYLTSSLDNIAMAYYNLGLAEDSSEESNAINSYKISIEKYKQFYNAEEHVDIANAFNNLGLVYEELEKYKEAAHYQKKALELYEAIYKRDHVDIAMALNNFGTCYATSKNEQMNYFFATIGLDYLIESHEMYERLASKDDYLKDDVKITAYNLGKMYLDLDLNENAKYYFKKALDLYDESDEMLLYLLGNDEKPLRQT